MKRYILTIIALLLLTVSVATADVVLMWFSDGPDLDLIKSQVAAFEKQKNEKVQLLTFPYYAEYKPKLAAMARAGNPPDLARETDVLEWQEFGIDLTKLIPKYTGMSVQEWLENVSVYKPAFKEVVKKFGKIVGIPYTSDAHAIFYNVEIFRKAGVTPPKDRPWTVREWYDAMVKIKRSGAARYALVFDRSPYRFSNLLYIFGGGLWDRQGKSIIIDSLNSIKALEFFVKLHDEDLIPKAVWLTGDTPAKYFVNGMAAMYVSGTWMLAQFMEQLKFEWSVMPWPVEKERVVLTGGKFLIPFTERGAELAFFLTNPENLASFCSELYLLPDRRDLVGKVRFKNPKIQEVYDIIKKDLNESTRGSMVWDWYHPDTADIIQKNRVAIVEAIIAAIAKQKTPVRAFQDLAKLLRDEVNRKKAR